ncbi:hypothetical protein B0A55_06376 [Friedmanniomyces simplex]|uniref:Uncharacterized protein n=1 Tax=Friedmanniomyces simplex TaxID=329884 RepID=A0A4U0XFG6_9PEZI|nr:hypothetical protein B0A55_06376 [Friedmanniomyces simplex]
MRAIFTILAAFGMLLVVLAADEKQCDTVCIRRILYETAYSSASAGIGLIMDAYNSTSWCYSDANEYWCPGLLNSTVAGIAGTLMNRTTVSEDSELEDLVSTLADMSRAAAVEAMAWATQAVNGTGGLSAADLANGTYASEPLNTANATLPVNPDPRPANATPTVDATQPVNATTQGAAVGKREQLLDKMNWTIWSLSQNTSTVVNRTALHSAAREYDATQHAPPTGQGHGDSGRDGNQGGDHHKGRDLAIGLGVPAAVLGPLVGYGISKALDPSFQVFGRWQMANKLFHPGLLSMLEW